ncbi:DKNYY domain-containing protein [Dyadobacter sp. 32]|uniref:DKNYY domain-containing protein n=1 Tax=Dyadobacter sp. 32 TaxID=538966 RepID=UPI0011EE5225
MNSRHGIPVMKFLTILSTFCTSYARSRPGVTSSPGYHITSNKVYYNGGFAGGPVYEVIGADAKSFEKLNKTFPESAYGRDKNGVYYNGKGIKGADVRSFERLRSYYSKDDRFIYFHSSVLSKDPDHFVFIDDLVQKDRNHVYRGGWIISDEPEDFQFIAAIDGFAYYRDHKGVLVNSTRLQGADPATFKPLRHGYSSDAHQVFQVDGMVARVIKGASPAGFDVYNSYYSHDHKHVYWKGKPLPGADPATFAILNNETHSTLDSKSALCLNNLIPGFRSDNFALSQKRELVFD